MTDVSTQRDVGSNVRPDPELVATVHALSAPFLRGRVERFIDLGTRSIASPPCSLSRGRRPSGR